MQKGPKRNTPPGKSPKSRTDSYLGPGDTLLDKFLGECERVADVD